MSTTVLPEPTPTRRRKMSPWRRLLMLTGVGLVLFGLGLLAWVGWQYYGTNIVSKHRAAEIKQSIQVDWGKGIDGNAIGLLRVDRFGKDFEVPIVKGTDAKSLAEGVGWDTKTAKPGQIGNFVIAGHRVTHGEPFAKFPKLRAGDQVVVETRNRLYTYTLRNSGTSIIVDFTTSWPLFAVPDPKARGVVPTKPVITMLTCSELFHTRNRSVVIGDLVSTVKKTGATTGEVE